MPHSWPCPWTPFGCGTAGCVRSLAVSSNEPRCVTQLARDTEPLPLDQLACELGVHQRTLRAAARTGRLEIEFSSRSVFGRPIRRATRQAAAVFMERYYRKSYSRFAIKPLPPNTHVPLDYSRRLRQLRRRLGLTQTQLATSIGAAGKAVIYQWESEKLRPSPVFWRAVEGLSRLRVEASKSPC